MMWQSIGRMGLRLPGTPDRPPASEEYMRFAMVIASGLFLVSASGCGGSDATATPTGAVVTPTVAVSPLGTSTPAAGTTAVPTMATVAPGATGTPAVEPKSGIKGLVTIGPTCPVEQPESPCPDRPYEATIQVLDEGGDVVAEVRSGADGRFEVEVPPGTYALHPVTATTPPSATDQVVEVRAGELTEVVVQFDSGIR